MTRSTGRGTSQARDAAGGHCVADCIADSAGGITFDLRGTGAPGAVLVLRRQGVTAVDAGDSDDEVRLPLTSSEESMLRAVLPSTVELAEGHWDVYAGGPAERPVRPGVRDVRALADRTPGAGRIDARVPYPTGNGTLAIRAWVRAPHAEAGTIRVEGGAMTVEGTLYGAELGQGAVVEARLRGAGRVHRVGATGGGGAFGFTLPYAPLAGTQVLRQQVWDLWLLPAEGGPEIRISRILDDVWDKRLVFVYPGHRAGRWLAAPFYTCGNDLCVRIDPV
jgi:hypothetical protein